MDLDEPLTTRMLLRLVGMLGIAISVTYYFLGVLASSRVQYIPIMLDSRLKSPTTVPTVSDTPSVEATRGQPV